MYAGELVESASTAAVVRGAAASLYARAVVLRAGSRARSGATSRSANIPGTVPQISPGFAGCAFRSRCGFANETCERAYPAPAGRRKSRFPLHAPARDRTEGDRHVSSPRSRSATCARNSASRAGCLISRRARRRRRRRLVRRAGRQRVRHRRRIRLRQVDAGAPDARADAADLGRRAGRRQAHSRSRPSRARAADPAGVPGSVRVAQPAAARSGTSSRCR